MQDVYDKTSSGFGMLLVQRKKKLHGVNTEMNI